MTIGFMVDYVIHFLLKYFELVDEKSHLFDGNKDKAIEAAISTMGSGVLIAGCTTVLSTLPLCFSKSSRYTYQDTLHWNKIPSPYLLLEYDLQNDPVDV